MGAMVERGFVRWVWTSLVSMPIRDFTEFAIAVEHGDDDDVREVLALLDVFATDHPALGAVDASR
jgi:hypothetical protein